MQILLWVALGGGATFSAISAIGHVIYRLRTDLGLTQAQLAKKAGVSKALIADFETGQKTYFTTKKQKKALAEALNITVEEFCKLIGGAYDD